MGWRSCSRASWITDISRRLVDEPFQCSRVGRTRRSPLRRVFLAKLSDFVLDKSEEGSGHLMSQTKLDGQQISRRSWTMPSTCAANPGRNLATKNLTTVYKPLAHPENVESHGQNFSKDAIRLGVSRFYHQTREPCIYLLVSHPCWRVPTEKTRKDLRIYKISNNGRMALRTKFEFIVI